MKKTSIDNNNNYNFFVKCTQFLEGNNELEMLRSYSNQYLLNKFSYFTIINNYN